MESKTINSKESILKLLQELNFQEQPGCEDFYYLQEEKRKEVITVMLSEIYGTWYAKVYYWNGRNKIEVGTSHDTRILKIYLVDAFDETGLKWPL